MAVSSMASPVLFCSRSPPHPTKAPAPSITHKPNPILRTSFFILNPLLIQNPFLYLLNLKGTRAGTIRAMLILDQGFPGASHFVETNRVLVKQFTEGQSGRQSE